MEPDRLLGVELRHFAALKAVAEHGSFGRAATALGYTQSAVSQQIAALERAVGMRLVERPGGPRPVTLTEAGQLLLRHADSIVARLQAAQADLAALAAGEAGALRVGTFQSVGSKVLPRILSRFAAAWPDVVVELAEANDDLELEHAVERGELDLAFVMMPSTAEPLETIELLRDPYVLVVRADSPLAVREKPPSLKEIASLPLIGFRQCRTTALVADSMRAAGSEPRFVFRSDDNATVQALVAAGIGIALMPRLTVDELDESVRTIAVGPKVPPRLIGIVWHRDRYHSPAARAFVETAQQVFAQLEQPASAAAA